MSFKAHSNAAGLTLSMPGINFRRRHFEIFLGFPEKRIRHFMQNVSISQYNILWKKHIINLSSAESA